MSRGEPVRVLLTAIGGGGHGEQILKALRLGVRDYWVLGTDANPACANRHKVEEFALLPLARDPGYLDALTALARRAGVRVIMHGSEPEMAVLSAARERLAAEGYYVPVNPPRVLDVCLDKARTLAHFAAHGVPAPAYREVSSLDDLEGFDRLPAVLKPSVGGGGSANVLVAQDEHELRLFAGYLLRSYPRFVVQEYVGTSDEEYTAGVLFGADGALLNSIVIRRIINNALTIRTRVANRTGRAELGPHLTVSTGISQGEVGRWPGLQRQCEAIARGLAPTAPINVQFRVVEGRVVPFEINPRFSGTTSLRALAGYNEPDVLIRRDLLGERIEPGFPYRTMTVLRGLEEMVVAGP